MIKVESVYHVLCLGVAGLFVALTVILSSVGDATRKTCIASTSTSVTTAVTSSLPADGDDDCDDDDDDNDDVDDVGVDDEYLDPGQGEI